MNYNTIDPNDDIASFVKCYWTLEAPKKINPEKQRIVPDGCMEMIFHYGDLYKQYLADGSFIIQPKCFVFGQVTQPLDIEPTGNIGIFAVRFLPDGFAPFTEFVLSNMENSAVTLIELFGEDGIILEQEVLNADTNEERVTIVEHFLTKIITNVDFIDRITKSSIAMILELNGQLSIDELSGSLNINRRQLERKFATIIGVSPKQLSKIIRLQATLKIIAHNDCTSLTAIAHNQNYYDQSHFIKDFKEFTGMSPKHFFANNLKMTALFSGAE